MKLNKIKTSFIFFILVFILAAISSKDSVLLAENAFDVAELFAADEDMEAGDVVVLAYTIYDYSNVASALGLEESELKKIMEKEGAADPLEIAEELEDAEKTQSNDSSFGAVTGNVINEIGLETDLTNILEPATNTTTETTQTNNTSTDTTSTAVVDFVGNNLSNAPSENKTNDETKTAIPADNIGIKEKIRKKLDEKDDKIGATGEDKLLASKAAVVTLTNVQNDPNIVGVVSSKPAFTMGFGSELRNVSSVPVALLGRVPVKVSLENGPISKGDPLTSAARKGYAAKSISSGRIIGYALEDYKAETKTGKILVFLQPGWYSAGEVITQQPLARIQEINGSVIIRLG